MPRAGNNLTIICLYSNYVIHWLNRTLPIYYNITYYSFNLYNLYNLCKLYNLKLYHQMILADEFEKQGIKLEFITQDMGTSPEERMFFNMRGLVAEYEREKIRERTIRGEG